MDKPEIFFIGTGSGTVSTKRYHSAFIIKTEKHNVLLEAGDGITRAIIQSGMDINEIDSIIISHFHPDHLNGISTLFNQMKMHKRKTGLSIYIHENSTEDFIKFINTSNIFLDRLKYDVEIISFCTDSETKLYPELSFIPRENTHLQKLSGKVPAEKLISSSFLFIIKGILLYYSGDIGSVKDLYLFQDSKPDYAIMESTHVSFEDIINFTEDSGVKQIFITHIPDDLEAEITAAYKNLDAEMRTRIILTNDFELYPLG